LQEAGKHLLVRPAVTNWFSGKIVFNSKLKASSADSISKALNNQLPCPNNINNVDVKDSIKAEACLLLQYFEIAHTSFPRSVDLVIHEFVATGLR
jgi:hypothetical protein